MFEKDFNFETDVLELRNEKGRPQHQLTAAVVNFADKYDSIETRNLMIVYYTGHGDWNEEDGLLELAA